MNMARYLALGLALPVTLAEAAPSVEVHGLLETDLYAMEDYSAAKTTDIVLSTMELGFDATINSMVDAQVVFLYEEDATDPPALDVGMVNLHGSKTSTFSMGRGYVPFGSFETNLLSDPVTLVLGETSESMLMWQAEDRGYNFAVYAFNGDSEETSASNNDTISYGAQLGLAQEGRFSLGVGYISNLADSDTIQAMDGGVGGAAAGSLTAAVSGLNAFFSWSAGNVTLIAEHVRAQDSFVAGDLNGLVPAERQPDASHAEISFTGAGGAVLSLGYQVTNEAAFLGLPETVMAAAISTEVYRGATIGLEYLSAEDYAVADGGSGEKSTLYTFRIGVEF